MRIRLVASAIVVFCAVVCAGVPARAQSTTFSFDRTISNFDDAVMNTLDLRPGDVTSLALGVGPGVNPAFEGGRDYVIHPVPVISLRYRDVLKVTNNQVDFTAFDQVIDLGGEEGAGRIDFGPQVDLDFGRSQNASPALRGMGNVGFSVELGGFVNYTTPNHIKIELDVTQDVANGHGGGLAELHATTILYRGSKFVLGSSAVFTLATSKYLKSFFGVTPAQSLASGLPVFHPAGGPKAANLGLNGNYTLSRHWSVLANIAYERLLGDAAASPLVTERGSPNQGWFSTFLVYAF